jgi:spore germination cell wall hydrolase CwlJ-like protein
LFPWLTYAKREFDIDHFGAVYPQLERAGIRLLAHKPSYPQQRRRQELQYIEDLAPRRSSIREYVPFVFAGLMLITAFAFAGHYIGRNADAHNVGLDEVQPLIVPTSSLITKGSLLPEGESIAIVNMNVLRRQTVLLDGKGDLELNNVVAPVPPPLPRPKIVKVAKVEKIVKISPASIDLKNPEDDISAVKRINVTPSVANADKTLKINKAEKQKVVAQRRVRLAEENCLARAVYFEARSETDMGQLAVAKVILNRVKNPSFPKSICGVVYQGSGTRNSCQFSFACDGQPDDVNQPGAWEHAKSIAQRAIAGDPAVAMMGSATNYHADYVNPRWAKTMRRLTKIGHHVFYSNG